jgi:hypothetical protein
MRLTTSPAYNDYKFYKFYKLRRSASLPETIGLCQVNRNAGSSLLAGGAAIGVVPIRW